MKRWEGNDAPQCWCAHPPERHRRRSDGSKAGSPDSSDGTMGVRTAVLLFVGCQPNHVYANVLPSWRHAARRLLVPSL